MKSLLAWVDDRTYERRTIFWCTYKYAVALWNNGFKKRTILFYPERPHVTHILYRICHILGYSITTNPRKKFDLAIAFQDTTKRPEDPTLSSISQKHRVLNRDCGDISKERVNRVFLESFGYGLGVDPLTYNGPYVKKPNSNAKHYGEVLHAPQAPEAGFVYQKLIDNQTDEHSATDIRTFIFGDDIPFTLYRKRSIHDRFRDDTVVATRVNTDEAFSKAEQTSILRFCRAFGLDYGELDILRDKNDGRIYIVDVNNTPSGPRPGVHMKKPDYNRFLAELTRSFEKMALKSSENISNHIPTV